MPAEALAVLLSGVLAAGVSAPAAEPPDPEMLEFLGEFETPKGQWLDPLSLDDDTAESPVPRREEKQP